MQIREYELGSKVHQDGIGILYHADNTETAERAYFKVLHEAHNNDSELVSSFHRCAEVCCSLENKNQLQTLAHGQEKGWHYIILEYSDFRPMESVLKDHNFVSIAETVSLMERLAINLRTYHIDGLVHGHLTPKNIFVDPDLTQVKLSDFGFEPLIRLLFQRKPKFLSDSISYYAPEIKTATEPAQRYTDIYSIGVIFYELLLSELPGVTLDLGNDTSNSKAKIIIPPSLQRLEIPELLDQLILSALETDVAKRCKNLSQFINKLYEAKSILAQAAGILVPRGAGSLSPGSENSQYVAGNGFEALGNDPNNEIPTREYSAARDTSENSRTQEGLLDSPNASSDQHSPEGQQYRDLADSRTAHHNADQHDQDSMQLPGVAGKSNGFDDLTETLLGNEGPSNGQHGKSDGAKASTGRPDASLPIDDFDRGKYDETNDFTEEIMPNAGPDRNGPSDIASSGRGASNAGLSLPESELIDIFENNGENQKRSNDYLNDGDPMDLGRIISDVDAHDREFLLTHTDEFATSDTISMYRPKPSHGSVWTKARVLIFVVLPMMVLAVVAVIAFNSDWFQESQALDAVLEPDKAGAKTGADASVQSPPKTRVVKPKRQSAKSETLNHTKATVSTPSDKSGDTIIQVPAVKGKTAPDRTKSFDASLSPTITTPETFIPKPKPQRSTPLSALTAATKANSELLSKPASKAVVSQSQIASTLLKVHVKYAQTPQKANVFVDGKLVGQSDATGVLTIPDLKTDRAYLVKVESKGFAMWAKEVQFKKAGFNHLHVGLQSLAAVQRRKTPNTPELQQKGRITVILANPNRVRYAFIYINGQLWKDSIAPAELALPEGKYVLEARRDGFRCDPPTRTINVVGGQSTSVRFYLNPVEAGM